MNEMTPIPDYGRGRDLYEPATEHDACGIGFLCNIAGKPSHRIVRDGFHILVNLTHRGACGCDPETGDGCGMLLQLPHPLFARVADELGFDLPQPGHYGVGMLFLPRDREARDFAIQTVERIVVEEGLRVLGWREVPRDRDAIGWLARRNEPDIRQVFVAAPAGMSPEQFETKLFVARKRSSLTIRGSGIPGTETYYAPSFSSRTIVYKGLMLPEAMDRYYEDLKDDDFVSAIALVHQRYSTNTLPSWPLAQPFRFLAHNGEINTLRGNINMFTSREHLLASPLLGEDVAKLRPVLTPDFSDSAIFDNAFEVLVRGGYPIQLAMAMMIPEPWSGHESMPQDKKDFYRFMACKMEPWDGPASMAFSDGARVGAVLDRNGLRPSRYWVTRDGRVIMASEAGVLEVPQQDILRKGRLQPGRMFFVDTVEGRIVEDDEIKESFARRNPYGEWLARNLVSVPSKPGLDSGKVLPAESATLLEREVAFGYTVEDREILIGPMAETGQEPVGSMGNDEPLAVLSNRPQLLYNYFKQLFAQVTNPPIDPIREEIVMSLETTIGREGNLLEEHPEDCRQLHLPAPILTDAQTAWIRELDEPGLRTRVLSTLFPAEEGPAGVTRALDRLCAEAEAAVDEGYSILVLSDRGVNEHMAALPALLATGGVHHHLVRRQKRALCGIVVESGEPREVMHCCLLLGYGAGAINPWLAYEVIDDMFAAGRIDVPDAEKAKSLYIKALNKGILKTMSKIGISTLQSYRCAQIFEALGLGQEVVDRCFAGTASRIAGIDFEDIGRETLMRHGAAWPRTRAPFRDPGGRYRWRRRGEFHQWNPVTIAKLQHATKLGDARTYEEFSREVNDRNRTFATLRGLLRFRKGNPVPLEEVEPAANIVKRFCTGAMSFGSISREAHETLAIAMNEIGGRSNTGEGGEDPKRFEPDPDGRLRRSAIKQVASARFGVTNEYLVNADELQIKMAQGAKPGEGGQLPGHKVFEEIAKVRYATPGVELISPPPHHDIYSIEDLAQLIHDLKNANVHAAVSVKLVSEVGVGTIAAGVSKGKADLVLISGHDGGTGASPLSSIKYAGLPWELGLAETHQVLVRNDLRDRIRVQVDGQLKTGRDVAIAALLGADEFGFATAPLIVSGCIMMRKCHLNTCPVGVATQDPELRKKFSGKPEYVIRYFFFVAEELRRIMAELGFRTVNEMIGRSDMLEFDPMPEHWKAKKVDLSRVLERVEPWEGSTRYCSRKQDHGIDRALDHVLMEKARPALERKEPVRFGIQIRNVNRTVGTMLSSELTRRHKLGMYGGQLPEDTVWIDCDGVAGQSFGAFAIQGVTLCVTGEANDYCGKGLSGGKIIVKPPEDFPGVPEKNIIVGNVALFGATGGEAYFRGVAGERFCVRNSGAWAVVEGVGDHGCEYMTGGRAVILGPTGRNFAAGMSGGVAFVYDPDGVFPGRCNRAMVDLKLLHAESLPELRRMLERHARYTGSPIAARILEHWEEELKHFIRVMPRDFARVIRERREREHAALAMKEESHVAAQA
ncbi:MAG TPA: glutamate synthase large subunit [Candidatus Hydrogenedentes bacterium]|nr:glutamate synthase large subunit [Candidatus Hydrogenedentota bacterium]